eukprot:6753244-Pyramimonas_sp.AAC.1
MHLGLAKVAMEGRAHGALLVVLQHSNVCLAVLRITLAPRPRPSLRPSVQGVAPDASFARRLRSHFGQCPQGL